MRPPRLTLGRLMALVAALAVVLAWWVEKVPRRREGFAYLAFTHRERVGDPAGYHARMAAKYEWAAGYPWLPTWPEPPAPHPDEVIDPPWPE